MMNSLTLSVAFAFVVAVSALPVELEWAQFKSTHAKQYVDDIEDAYRHGVWLKNRKYIRAHNEAYLKGEHSYFLGENEFADMTNEEFVKTMNGYRMRDSHEDAQVHEFTGDVKDLPTDVDWRTKGYVTDVKNQGQCGSCWAFSTTGSLEGQTFKKYGKLTSLSEQNLVDCSGAEGNKGCQGGLMDSAFKYIQKNNGIDTEDSYPYKGVNEKCHFDKSHVGANLTGFVDVKSGDESALQSAVATVGPISVAIDASHMSFQLYSGGVYHAWFCSPTRLDHGVLAVGYGTDSGKDYWLVKNSWGPSWGIKGYIMMSRNKKNNCGIATQASYPTV